MRKIIANLAIIMMAFAPTVNAGGLEDFVDAMNNTSKAAREFNAIIGGLGRGVVQIQDIKCNINHNPQGCRNVRALEREYGRQNILDLAAYRGLKREFEIDASRHNTYQFRRSLPQGSHINQNDRRYDIGRTAQNDLYSRSRQNRFVPNNNRFTPNYNNNNNNRLKTGSFNGKTPYPRGNGRCKNGYFSSENDDGSWWCR